MSYEGYEQALCENGHQYIIDQYPTDDQLLCPVCKSKCAWTHSVDLTNGCHCEYLKDNPDWGKCPAHTLKLEVLTPVQTKECPTCHHHEIVAQPTFKIPKLPLDKFQDI